MKIALSNHYNTRLCELYFGDVFELFGKFYMLANTNGRMNEVANSPKFCCVRLTDGECEIIDSAEKVHPINAVLELAVVLPEDVNE